MLVHVVVIMPVEQAATYGHDEDHHRGDGNSRGPCLTASGVD
jgi:hypothetical protein